MPLHGSSKAVANELKEKIQEKVEVAPEVAAAMLQRQQASAIIDARQMIVEVAVSMVDMALKQKKQAKEEPEIPGLKVSPGIFWGLHLI